MIVVEANCTAVFGRDCGVSFELSAVDSCLRILQRTTVKAAIKEWNLVVRSVLYVFSALLVCKMKIFYRPMTNRDCDYPSNTTGEQKGLEGRKTHA